MRKILQNITESFEAGNHLELVDENFSKEILFDQNLQYSILGGITFVNVNFKSIDFTSSFFPKIHFENSRFNTTIFRKMDFWNYDFLNCRI